MRLSLIIIGDEILLGRVVDTNSGTIARLLSDQGCDIVSIRTVGDNGSDIRKAVEASLEESDLVISTGGLGPTRDDITKTVLTSIFGGSPVENPEVRANVERIFRERGIKMNDLTLSQAFVPSSCRVIQNLYGTAPVMWFEKEGKVFIAMPGVPFETRGMLPIVADEIRGHFHPHITTLRREFTVSGISESALAERLAGFEDDLPRSYKLAYLPSPGVILLRLEGNPDTFETYATRLVGELGELMTGIGKLTPAENALSLLRKRGLTLATAESCTGGNIAHLITSVAGCSDIFVGGIVSYSNSVKENVLGVRKQTLEAYGAVSEQTVREMAEGACRATGASCAVATSGIAGPGGGTPEKPTGTVWIAVHTPAGTTSQLSHFSGDRQAVIDRASATALMLLSKNLN